MNVNYKPLILLWLLFLSALSFSQNTSLRVVYRLSSNGQIQENQKITLLNNNQVTTVFYNNEQPRNFIDLENNTNVEVLYTKTDTVKQSTSWLELEHPEILPETDTLLGFVCQKARLSIYSNQIEVWFTDSLGVVGSPYTSVIPGYGLVLKVVRNGNLVLEAISVEQIESENKNTTISGLREVSKSEFKALQIRNRYSTLNIFDNEIINFGDSIVNPVGEFMDTTYRFAKGTVVLKKIKLPKLNGNQVFANLTVHSNGDAYDRTGSVFILSPETPGMLEALRHGIDQVPVYKVNDSLFYQGIVATEAYTPPLEIMRFFTSFGVGHFNERVDIDGYSWANESQYVTEVTPLLRDLPEEIWIGVFIGNYDKGGHQVDLSLNIYPGFEHETKKYWVKTIFNTLNIMEMEDQNYPTLFLYDSLKVEVNIPENVKNLALYFTTTGHGGWENGDEFNQKTNEIFVNDSLVFKHIPWRSDCATYRLLNPASGNFSNGLSSSDLSRSNWCPGTASPPFIISLDKLKAGKHTFKVAIPMGKPEGGSFSAWSVSGILVGEIIDN